MKQLTTSIFSINYHNLMDSLATMNDLKDLDEESPTIDEEMKKIINIYKR